MSYRYILGIDDILVAIKCCAYGFSFMNFEVERGCAGIVKERASHKIFMNP